MEETKHYSVQYRVLESVLCATNQTRSMIMKIIKFMVNGKMLPKCGPISDVIVNGYLKLSRDIWMEY